MATRNPARGGVFQLFLRTMGTFCFIAFGDKAECPLGLADVFQNAIEFIEAVVTDDQLAGALL
jgi:hypothetical protein